MSTKAANAREIPDVFKEAVADAILNNLSARVSGQGDFHRVVSNARPSDLLVSGFIVAKPEELRSTDEEENPLQINAHGLDFHVSEAGLKLPVTLRLGASAYVRVFPSQSDVAPGGPLFPAIDLNSAISKELNKQTREAEEALRKELGVARFREHENKDWEQRRLALRREIHVKAGIPFDEKDQDDQKVEDSNSESVVVEETDSPEEPPQSLPSSKKYGVDDLYEPAEPPQKWLRLELDLPSVTVTLAECDEQKVNEINEHLNAAIAAQLNHWLDTTGRLPDSDYVAYKSGTKILPSNLLDWKGFLRSVCANKDPFALPRFEIRWAITATTDPLKEGRQLVHIAVENWSPKPSDDRLLKDLERSLFRVQVSVELQAGARLPLLLDRVKPSYRYNKYLEYPALGFNCGVTLREEAKRDILTTTWSPHYALPRIVPNDVSAERRFAELAKKEGLDALEPLVKEFRDWIEATRTGTAFGAGLSGAENAELLVIEKDKFNKDLGLWAEECDAIDRGIRLLKESRDHWTGPGPQKDPLGVPFEAWLTMNAAMGELGKDKYVTWRLFQIAFILAQIPTFASRIKEFHGFYKEPGAEKQANSVTLLYFATGGGKSEAFLGLLLFVLVLDRLRQKERGVSALMRYPLRLLTLQQARRTMRVLAVGEAQRISRGHPGEPLSLGFWVGSSNTPNRRDEKDITQDVPLIDKVPAEQESELDGNDGYNRRKKAWLKIETCPFCNADTVLRRASKREGHILGHYCTAELTKCTWGRRFGERRALPFYIVDEDIYAIAPSVLLGTIDKLAVIGQSFKTIRRVLGMFGMAPFRDRKTGHLETPIGRRDWDSAAGNSNLEQLFPAFDNGTKAFFDPFPSLLIQDEAHLLEESLGTFAGLFESALDAGLDRLSPLLGTYQALDPLSGERRRIKVIAASATVSEPERQMWNLYQRDSTSQFPYPGPSLYSSFYAIPKVPSAKNKDPDAARAALGDPEKQANSARIYAAIVTNGHRHTVSVSSILGQYHLQITQLYEALRNGGADGEKQARSTLMDWLSNTELKPYYGKAIQDASGSELLTLVDLHRIALTYVTNKKGGDQVIDTERSEFEDLHQAAGFESEMLKTSLISGAVTASQIQEVVSQAERRVKPGAEFPNLSDTLRSIIATSAVSHGVDVEEFNAMFFAGLPSDIAEYIQASSRVGRTHVGFSLLIPVPQRARDRFVVEIFDIYHRFLERMVLPAAVDRWAEKAVQRALPSIFQEYLCGISRIVEIAAAPAARKGAVSIMNKTADADAYLAITAQRDEVISFMWRAVGLHVKPPVEAKEYYTKMVPDEIDKYRKAMHDTGMGASELREFFGLYNRELRPMTSLRDVDLQGIIREGLKDSRGNKVHADTISSVMEFIRRGKVGELDEEEAGSTEQVKND